MDDVFVSSLLISLTRPTSERGSLPTADGTATGNGSTPDYNKINGDTLTFPAIANPDPMAMPSQTITVFVNGDDQPDLNETFFVNLILSLHFHPGP